jgi:NAD(P)-dependent dehydrogenase (short-subunit alcohol dehydrogenase family)
MEKKSVLITGANGGIGMALCEGFTNEGYFVIATDKVSGKCQCDKFLQLDINVFVGSPKTTEVSSLRNLIPANGLDCLVNNAATQILGSTEDITLDDWINTLNTNLLAPFFTAQNLLKSLEKKHGSVINIGSVHARSTKPNFVCYATSKSALVGLTRSMAVDLGPRIRVNAINPAATATPMLLAGFEGKEKEYAELSMMHPLERIAEPKEIAQAAIFLASQQSTFITGASLDIDGGISQRLHDPL